MPNIVYRMTVYAGLYSDASDTSVLTPVAGAPHSDTFKVATATGITGFQPYMDVPRGKRGSLRLPEQKLEVGSYTVTLLDKRTGDGNLNRWVTAFFGNSTGKMEIVGKKAYIEESVNGGTTWNPFFVGQITDIEMDSATQFSLVIRDNVQYLKEPMFTTYPRVSYSSFTTLVPPAISRPITNEENEIVFRRTPGINFTRILKESSLLGDRVFLSVGSFGANDPRNIWPLDADFSRNELYFGMSGVTNGMRILFNIGNAEYVFGVEFIRFLTNNNSKNTVPRIDLVSIYPLLADDGGIGVPADLPTGIVENANFWIFKYDSSVTSDNGVYLANKWDTILKDAFDGKFYAPIKWNGTTIPTSIANERKTAYDVTSLAAVTSSRSIPRPAFYIDKSESGVEWIEKNLLAPYSVGYTMEPAVINSVPQCRARFFSTAVPTSLSGLLTLGESDVVSTIPEWTAARPIHRVEGKHFTEIEARISSDNSVGAQNPTKATYLLENKTVIVNELSIDDSSPTYTLDMNGVRAFASVITPNLQLTYNQNDIDYNKRKAIELLTLIFNRFKAGSPTVIAKTLRNTNTDAMKVGDFVLVEISVLPNQALHTRGGTRLMQITNKHAMGVHYEIELLDSGVNQTMNNPTVGTPSTSAAGIVSVSVTTNQSAKVHVQFAAVVLNGSQPSVNSPAWTSAAVQTVNNTTQTISFQNVPEGRTIFVRARTESPNNVDTKLPSAWVVGGSVSLTNISAPTSVSVTNITTRSATVTWTNTNSTLPIEIFMASPAGALTTKVADLPPSSSIYYAQGLNLNTSTSHRVGVRYTDPFVGFGAFGTADFTATGTAIKLDAPAAISLYITR